ncbi:hypothetical protein LNV09_07490 [Paucibacter sp. B2R-40]|uniref:hypothetical protein n=1 Tax=Paucibacter sp. B2R-40 TaxID=2893554 RepID=UPI0021E4D190|nr:hypothetical protein [Paucibacter sp. B2R-40]MCV2354008.1 hypothetical protein [Paucibacter sp. B2R-40]
MNDAFAVQKKTLYLQILPFHMGAYVGDAPYAGQPSFPESYSHDADHYYLVIQPMLRHLKDQGGTHFLADESDSPGIVEYLTATSWDELAVAVLPPATIQKDFTTRRNVAIARNRQLAKMDQHFTSNAPIGAHLLSDSSKPVSELAALGFQHLRDLMGSQKNAGAIAPVQSAYDAYEALADPDYIPVPFPPNTKIALNFLLGPAGAGVHQDVHIDLDPVNPVPAFMKLSTAQWTTFCQNNFIQQEKENWVDLAEDEKTQFRDWAEGVYVAMASAKVAGPLDPDPAVAQELQVVWDNYFTHAHAVLSVRPTNDESPRTRWTAWITKTSVPGGAPLMADASLFAFLRNPRNFVKPPLEVSPYWEHTGRLQFPRYYIGGKKLKEWMLAAADQHSAALEPVLSSYHARFWDGFAREAAKIAVLAGQSTSGAYEEAMRKEVDLGAKIAAAIAFGERLRMPRPTPFDNHNIIVLKPSADDIDDPDWMVTCNHSLLGQTLRLGPLADAHPGHSIQFESLDIQLPGHPTAVNVFPKDKTELAKLDRLFSGLVSEARGYRANGSTVKMALGLDPYHPGRIFYERQMFSVARTRVKPPASELLKDTDDPVLFGVPTALLDAVEPTVAFNVTPASDQIRQMKPRRQLFAQDNLSNDRAKAPWNAVQWLARAPVMLRRASLGAYSGDDIFEFALAANMPAPERELYSMLFTQLKADGGARAKADLWKESSVGTDMAFDALGSLQGCVVLSLTTKLIDGISYSVGCLVQLDSTAATKAGKWLQGVGTAASGTAEIPIDLVADALMMQGHFNLLAITNALAADLDKSQMIPRALFNFKPAIGVDGIMERFSLEISGPSQPVPALAPDNDHFLKDMLQSFAKARFFLCPGAETAMATRRDFWLSYPAAVLPLKPETGLRDDPAKNRPAKLASGRAYWVIQHFTAPPKTAPQHGIGNLATHPEERRYLARLIGPQANWHLGATLENPFGIRLGAAYQDQLRLGYAAPVQNLASTEIGIQDGAGKTMPLPFLHFLVTDADATHKRIVLTLDKQAIAASLQAGPASLTSGSVLDKGPKMLRSLYETLCDLRDASIDVSEGRTGVKLILEAWRYDGNAVAADAPVSQLPADHQEFPAIVAGLRKIALGAGAAHYLDAAALAPWLKALTPTYAGFIAALQGMANDPAPNALDIKLLLATGSPAHAEQALVYRVGLEINRNAAAIVPCPKEPAGFVVVPPDKPDQIMFRQQSLVGPAAATAPRAGALSAEACRALLLENDEDTQSDALAEYQRLAEVADSPWRQAHDWISPSGPRSASEIKPAQVLGELAAKVQFLAAPFATIPRQQANLYYVLYGFVPLPALSAGDLSLDAATTFQFGNFVAEILGSVMRGETSVLAGLINIELGSVKPAEAANTLKQQASATANLFAIQVAQHWLDPVHHPKNSTATMVKRFIGAYGGQYRDCMASLLRTDPTLYAKSKGIAIGAFETGKFPDQLAYLQISKRVLRLSGVAANKDASLDLVNTERFPVMQIQSCPAAPGETVADLPKLHRYFVDVLEDATYGDFFDIAMPRKDRPFGDAIARSAADFLTQSNLFDNLSAQKPGERAIELTVVHEETAWRIQNQPVYILPARKPPATPKPVLPVTPGRITTAWQQLYGTSKPGGADKSLAEAFEKIFFGLADPLHRHFPSMLELADGASTDLTQYKRLTPDKFPLKNTQAPDAMPKGWHHVDTSYAHFYFLVESSESNAIDLDQFTMTLKRRPLRGASSTGLAKLVADDERDGLRALLAWHTYHVAKQRNAGAAPQVAPPALHHDKLDPALRTAIGLLWPSPAPALAVASEPVESFEITLRRTEAGWAFSETFQQDGTWTSELGGVVGIDVLASQTAQRTFLLHLVVLHQPWSSLDATLSIQRNLLDLDGKNGADINERFVMASDKSELVWVDPSTTWIDFHKQPTLNKALRTMIGSVGVSEWLAAGASHPDTPFSIEDAFKNAFHNLTLDHLNPNFPKMPVWNVKLMKDNAFMVEGRVDYVDRELAPRVGSTELGATPMAVVAEREDAKIRTFLTSGGLLLERRVQASDAHKLMFLNPALVKTPWPNVSVTWTFGAGEQHARQTLMNVTIPVRWLPENAQMHHAESNRLRQERAGQSGSKTRP